MPTYVPTNGLVGWWPFNGNANDESGNGNNGTVNGATLTADRFGNSNEAFNFDGVSQFIEVASASSISVSLEYSVSVWINANIWSFDAPIDQHSVVSKIDNGDWYGGYEIRTGSVGYIMHSGNIGSNFAVGAGNYSENIWHHVLVTYDGSYVRSYINGIVVDSAPRTGSLQTSSIPLRFGRRGGAGSYNNWFSGKIDDIAIWNRALTQCEILDLYNAQLGSSSNVSETSCGSFFWNNNTYTQSGQYQFLTTNALGCDSTATLNLTINQPSASIQTQTALDSYTWPVNGQTYTQSGTYSAVIPNAVGCDSTITLDLTLAYTGIEDLQPNTTKKLLKITDLNGKETPFQKNTVLLFIYEDGTVERVFEGE